MAENQNISSSQVGVFGSYGGYTVGVGYNFEYGIGFYGAVSAYAGYGRVPGPGASLWGQINYNPTHGFTYGSGVYAGLGSATTPLGGRVYSLEEGISPSVKGNLFATGGWPVGTTGVTVGGFVEISSPTVTAITSAITGLGASIREAIPSESTIAVTHGRGLTTRKVNLIELYQPDLHYLDVDKVGQPQCFPPSTLISLPNGAEVAIENLSVGCNVTCFSICESSGKFAIFNSLIGGSVVRQFQNVTSEWITLRVPTLTNSASDNPVEITSTPGHVFLCPDGQFRRLCDMIDSSVVPLNSDALAHKEGAEHYRPIGMVEIVLEDGTIAKAEAHSIKYSAATAHLYEEAEMLITRTEGGLAIKPEMKKGWKTYNFEVAEHHTYIADGIDPAANDNFRGRAAA